MLEMPETFVKNGKPVFGTFKGHPYRLDVRGVKYPYGSIPFPRFITNLRIKSRIYFYFNIGEYIGYIFFMDAKITGFAEVVFWNVSTKKKYSYHSVIGPRKRLIPHNLEVASTACYKKSRYIRISWDRKHDKLSVMLNISGDSLRPSVNGAFLANFSDSCFAENTYVLPAPTSQRCSASYVANMSLKGTLSITPKNSNPTTVSFENKLCFFEMNRTYPKFRSYGEFMVAFGTVNGKPISFRLESKFADGVNPERVNGNVMFYDGEETLFPPVVITHPYGINEKWIIQDTENMIDLTFHPISDNLNSISVVALRTVYHSIYGTFEGTVQTAKGEKILFKSLEGITEKYSIRL